MKKSYRHISGRLNIIISLLILAVLNPSFLSAMDKVNTLEEDLLSGSNLYDRGRYNDALKFYLNLLKDFPGNGTLLYETAVTNYALNDYGTALTFAQKAEALLPGSDKVKILLGNIFDKIKRSDDALEQYLAAIKINPKSDSACYNLGVFYYNNGRYKEAGEAFITSLGINGNNPSAYYSLGCVYVRLNDTDSAKEAFRRFLDMEKKSERSDEVRKVLKTIILSRQKK